MSLIIVAKCVGLGDMVSHLHFKGNVAGESVNSIILKGYVQKNNHYMIYTTDYSIANGILTINKVDKIKNVTKEFYE